MMPPVVGVGIRVELRDGTSGTVVAVEGQVLHIRTEAGDVERHEVDDEQWEVWTRLRIDDWQREVASEARKVRVRQAARDEVDAERRADARADLPPLDCGTLNEILARPAEPPARAEGLIPTEAGTLVVAQRKTGKTTAVLNVARSFITGEDLFGRFKVRPIEPTSKVGFLNYEVSAQQLARWADDIGVPRSRLFIVNLRGTRNPLDDPEDKELLAEVLAMECVEALIVDPFGRAYTGQSQNDPGEVGAWLADLDRWARPEGVKDVLVTAHAGWVGERARGASALEDWADSIMTMTRGRADDQSGEDDDASSRYLRADGRDVSVDEDRLEYDPATRLLSLTGQGSRRVAGTTRRVAELVPDVVAFIEANIGCSQRDLEGAHLGRAEHVRAAAKQAAEQGLITRSQTGRGFTHMPAERPSASVRPTASRDARDDCVPASIWGRRTQSHPSRSKNKRTRDAVSPSCTSCGQPLLFIVEGRDVCEKCRRAKEHDQ